MRTIAVKDHLAIAREGGRRFSVVGSVMSKPIRIDANGTGDALTLPRVRPAALQIDNKDLFASVQLGFELFWCDPRQSKLAYEATPPSQLAAEVDTEPSERNECEKLSHPGGVSGRTVQVSAEGIAESAIDA
jgi:hypothetical protein